ncbi:hypothetical protein CROQUDRAFT_651440 [Cronartium quercuum f. sp. fusiforme G11]|uniref:ACB domain-containing protein n=1 Tax=Cronartium quercuum f. sp. fusiforme G11 TaxID=708437 RepID=A0A9P6NQ00_9BASI|nr:hypothetical protein CROQUDRAFT_651440 [Cronartium quercuum f. sp. fusiforme G11]
MSKPDSSPQLSHLTTAEKLRFYALFKLVTTSGAGPLRAPSFWDFEGKAKADIWKATKLELEKTSQNGSCIEIVELAALEYIEKASRLGWVDSSREDPLQPHEREEQQQQKLVFELSKFLAEEGWDALQITPDETERDSGDENDEEDSAESESTTSERDEFGLRLDPNRESRPTTCEKTSDLKEHPIINMAPVSRMLDVTALNDPSSGEPSLHDLVIDNDQSGVERYLSLVLKQGGNGHVERLVNQYNTDGYTPLHLASDRGNFEMVRILINSGSDPSLKDEHDCLTARELACEAGMIVVENYLTQLEIQA